jgi:hypothetical protein
VDKLTAIRYIEPGDHEAIFEKLVLFSIFRTAFFQTEPHAWKIPFSQ